MSFGPLLLHINYLEHEEDVVTICRKAADFGYDGVEFRRVPSSRQIVPESYLDLICRGVDESGLSLVSFGGPGPDLMQEDDAAIRREIDVYLDFVETARLRLPLGVVNIFAGPLSAPGVPPSHYHKHGSAFANQGHWDRAVSGYREIAKVAEQTGMKMAFETHMHYLHDTVSSTKRLVTLIGSPSVGINLDLGNTLLFENPPSAEDQLRMCGGDLFYLHCKNFQTTYGGDKLPSALGSGAIDYRSFLKSAFQAGFTGPICLEAPRPGDREWYAQEDISYLRALLADLDEELSDSSLPGQLL